MSPTILRISHDKLARPCACREPRDYYLEVYSRNAHLLHRGHFTATFSATLDTHTHTHTMWQRACSEERACAEKRCPQRAWTGNCVSLERRASIIIFVLASANLNYIVTAGGSFFTKGDQNERKRRMKYDDKNEQLLYDKCTRVYIVRKFDIKFN